MATGRGTSRDVTGFDSMRMVGDAPAPFSPQHPTQHAAHPEVYLEVGVLPTQLAPLRVVAADLAARADFDLDTVSDLRMAVDEACSTLAALARPGGRIQCVVQVDTDCVTVTAQVVASRSARISQDTFGWRVLSTLTDQVEVFVGDELARDYPGTPPGGDESRTGNSGGGSPGGGPGRGNPQDGSRCLGIRLQVCRVSRL